MEYITLSKSDPLFHDYLEGSFSSDLRAIPVNSFNINTQSEKITFKLVPLSEIEIPPLWKKFFLSFRIHETLLFKVPMIWVFLLAWGAHQEFNVFNSLLSFLGVYFLFLSVNLRNDYSDYIYGVDRISSENQIRSLRKGWFQAAALKKISYGFLVLGIVCGVPIFIHHQLLFLFVGLGVLILIGIQFSSRLGLKYKPGSELASFLLFGPFLTSSFFIAITGKFSIDAFFLGVISGFFSVIYIWLKNFENILVNAQAGINNTITSLGFDKAKKIIFISIIFANACYILFQTYQENYLILLFSFLTSFILFKDLFVKLFMLKSCIGSDLKKIRYLFLQIYFSLFISWILAIFFEFQL